MFATTRQISGCWNLAAAKIDGLQGSADVGRGRIEGRNAWQFRGRRVNPYQVEHDVLIEAIRQGKSHNEVEYAARSTMTAILGRMASYSGQELAWDAALQSSVRLAPERYAFDAKPPVAADAAGRYPVAMPGVTKVL
jgi:hypothetical protein